MNSEFSNWSDVRIFLAVYRAGSTLAASKILGIAQPTVARRIEALEHTLKLTLFDRDTRGFRATDSADRLLTQAEAMESAATGLQKEAERARRTNSSPIRFTAPMQNFSSNMAAILSDFRAEHPETQFELIGSYELLDLTAGDADIALRMAPQITDERLICVKLTTVTASLYASQDYARKMGVPKDETELEGHNFVCVEWSRAFPINKWLLDRISPDQIVSRSSNLDGMVTAVKAGLGIGPVATSLANDDGTLIRCFPPPKGTESYSWLLISPEAYKRPEVKAFAKFFAPRFRAIFRQPTA